MATTLPNKHYNGQPKDVQKRKTKNTRTRDLQTEMWTTVFNVDEDEGGSVIQSWMETSGVWLMCSTGAHRRRSSVNFGGLYIFARKYMHGKLTKCPNFGMIYARQKLTKCDFCPKKILFARIWGGGTAPYPPSPKPMLGRQDICRVSQVTCNVHPMSNCVFQLDWAN